jgi:hypothetical protein
VASAALKIVFEMSVVILSISSIEKMDSQSVSDNNRLYKPADWNKFRKIRNDVTSLVRKARDAYQDKLVNGFPIS